MNNGTRKASVKQRSRLDRKEPVWLQVTSGQGPEECGWVVAQVTKVIMQEADRVGLSSCIVESLAFDKVLRNQSLIEPESYRSVLLKIDGFGANLLAAEWVGTIRWQGESTEALKQGRPNHKRMNWYVGVIQHQSDASDKGEIDLQSKDLSFEAIRSSGPGGQHVNKTSSAVRLTHLPTGIQVRVDTDRSQHRNKQLAMERLKMILAESHEEKRNDDIRGRWLSHYQVSRGNPSKTFIGKDFIERR